MHGLAFKQSMMTLVGFSIVFATLFGVLSFKVQSELSTLLTEKGEEISLANVAIIEKLFEKGKKLGDEYAMPARRFRKCLPWLSLTSREWLPRPNGTRK